MKLYTVTAVQNVNSQSPENDRKPINNSKIKNTTTEKQHNGIQTLHASNSITN